MLWCVWTESETEFFIKLIKDEIIKGILDAKPQKNVTIKSSKQI